MEDSTPMNRVIGRVEGKLESITSTVDSINEKLDSILDKLQSHDSRLVTLETTQKSFSSKAKWLGTVVAGILIFFFSTLIKK